MGSVGDSYLFILIEAWLTVYVGKEIDHISDYYNTVITKPFAVVKLTESED